jgi:hypothetical protein
MLPHQVDHVRAPLLLYWISRIHFWNVYPDVLSRLNPPSRRTLYILWSLTALAWVFIILVLSIGNPEWHVYPDRRLEGLMLSPIFWISVTCWFLFGMLSPLLGAKWGVDALATVMFALLILLSLAYPLFPHLAAGFYPGLGLGSAIEGTLFHLRCSGRR